MKLLNERERERERELRDSTQSILQQTEAGSSKEQAVSLDVITPVSANMFLNEQESSNKCIAVGMIFPENNTKIHQRNWVYHIEGVCPTLCATDYKDPKRILVYE